ncbi:LacI family DNA-binding transcriptional regulator [Streptococcus ovis]|uniref:LacI family DNA-binding transcriptional regulator n=1 Tax=Streptococcus ovis TaxID=82806 RepID=UPI00036FCDB8|nr:LacI family DNA-binding transcriptional regulator [Streptococcus ovis]
MREKITIKTIAEMASTSKTTVSFYLNQKFDKMSEETRNRIQKVIEETGYQPSVVARSLNSKQTKMIGVLIGDITNSFSNQIVKGIENVTKQKGYQIIIGNSNYDSKRESQYIESMLDLGVDGFIIQPTSNFRKYSRVIKDMKKHMVFFDSQLYEHKTNWVKTNNYDAVYDMVQGCIEKGYRKFIMVTADTSLLSTRIERASGFVDSLTDKGYDYETLVIDNTPVMEEDIIAFLKKTVPADENTLVFAPNCWALPTVLSAMKKLEFDMPRVGLVGFDNLEWTDFSTPTVSTIVQPAYEEGEQAAQILIDEIEGNVQIEKQQIFDCQVAWKESTL